MTRAARPCPVCKTPTRTNCCTSRSGKHTKSTTERGLGWEWQKLQARTIRAQPWCTDCGHTGSQDNPLTGDHVIPRSVDPSRTLDPTNVVTRCRHCNSRKGTR